jgi:predicted nuclease with RNAse H fold
MNWVGVDVGGERKGFDMAVIDHRELRRLHGRLTCAQVVEIVEAVAPAVVGIDSPRVCAPDGARSRECERRIATEICGIRYTPDASAVDSSDYYAWIVHGLGLYGALESVEAEVIEVFPTASWTRWLGERGHQRRSAWTSGGLTKLALASIPKRTNQDQRDAIAAALTARQYSDGTAQRIGEIVVPAAQA